MKVTQVLNRSILNKISYWLYKKFCNEPYIPEGKINVVVEKKGDTAASKESVVKISFIPERFTKGIHTLYLFDKLNCEIVFFEDLLNK